jgi:hypothetical protein
MDTLEGMKDEPRKVSEFAKEAVDSTFPVTKCSCEERIDFVPGKFFE